MADERYQDTDPSADVTGSTESVPEEAAETVASAGADVKAESEDKGNAQAAGASEAGQSVEEEPAELTPEDKVILAQTEAAEMRDRFTRLQAEWDNFRKRSAAEREQERARAAEHLVTNILPVLDDFERAIKHAQDNPDSPLESLIEGVSAVHAKLLGVLGKERVAAINPLNEAFDANCHQAVNKVEDDSVPDETVVAVYQKGYEMAGKVIRPAMVAVSSGGPIREKEPVEEDE